jgi:hypothetical protein
MTIARAPTCGVSGGHRPRQPTQGAFRRGAEGTPKGLRSPYQRSGSAGLSSCIGECIDGSIHRRIDESFSKNDLSRWIRNRYRGQQIHALPRREGGLYVARRNIQMRERDVSRTE